MVGNPKMKKVEMETTEFDEQLPFMEIIWKTYTKTYFDGLVEDTLQSSDIYQQPFGYTLKTVWGWFL